MKRKPRNVPTPEALLLGVSLRKLREARTLSKQEVLRRVATVDPVTGFSVSAYCHWEAGRRVLSPRQLLALLRALEEVSDGEVLLVVQQAAHADDTYLGAFIGLQGAAPGAAPESAAHRRTHWEQWAQKQRQFPSRARLWR